MTNSQQFMLFRQAKKAYCENYKKENVQSMSKILSCWMISCSHKPQTLNFVYQGWSIMQKYLAH